MLSTEILFSKFSRTFDFIQERKSFDEKFIKTDTKQLCELASAADSLQLRPLVDLTSRALARIIEGRTPEEIREIFHLPDDLTEVLIVIYLFISMLILCLLLHFNFASLGGKIGAVEKCH